MSRPLETAAIFLCIMSGCYFVIAAVHDLWQLILSLRELPITTKGFTWPEA
jgi:hypothetical protein